MQLSVQCFTLREEFSADVEGALAQIRAIGYEFIETAGDYGLGAEALASKIHRAGLRVSGMHVGLDTIEGGLARTLEDAGALGSPFVIVPWVGAADYADGWDVLGKRLEAIAGRVVAGGFRFAYHNHAFEFVRLADGRTGFDTLFATAEPKLVGAEIDVWWANCGGEAPAELIRRHGARTPLVHLKDGSSCDDDVHRAAGDGILDWEPILAACVEASVEYGVVELDRSPGSAMEAVALSYAFFASKGLT